MADASGSRLAAWTNVSTIIASIAAVAAFAASFCFFERTTEVQENANAVTIMNEHIKLFVETPALHDCHKVLGTPAPVPPLPSPPNAAPSELPKVGQCVDAAEHAAFTAETIYDLAPEDAAWLETVTGMIRDNRWWFESKYYRPDRYDSKFQTLVLKHIPSANKQSVK